tara:strand:- start:266 stop:691 length:426 start_codon:yes stop_codon:yes gene_type:complete
MKIKLIFLGKKKRNSLDGLIMKYFSRIQKEISSELIFVPNFKKKISYINNDDFVILIDEKGVQYDSILFSEKIKIYLQDSVKSIVFIVGDAYGFSEKLYKRSNQIISLSKLTFTHEIARLIIVEQLYRSITIIKNHPYHHE